MPGSFAATQPRRGRSPYQRVGRISNGGRGSANLAWARAAVNTDRLLTRSLGGDVGQVSGTRGVKGHDLALGDREPGRRLTARVQERDVGGRGEQAEGGARQRVENHGLAALGGSHARGVE